MITVVNYGAGNLRSVTNTLEALGARHEVTHNAAAVEAARAVILPGVGHFGQMMEALDRLGLREALISKARSGAPLLGICLGLQTLYAGSEEAPQWPGLSVFAGTVRSLPRTVKLPHMGWNQIQRVRPSRLLRGIDDTTWFYFAHSYAALDDAPQVCAVCEHGARFAAVIEQGHVMAVQFHPEKSGAAGLQVLQNFLEAIR